MNLQNMRTSEETLYFPISFFFIKNSAEGKSLGPLLTSNPEQCMVVHVTLKWIILVVYSEGDKCGFLECIE